MMEVDPVSIPIGDSNQQHETIPTYTENSCLDLKSLPDKPEETESKINEEVAPSEVSDTQIESEILLESTCEMKTQDENINRTLLQHRIYNYISGSCVFLVNKVMIPIGEHVLLNSTLWTILKLALEIFLEMLLYIILAICYVFLKFISQLEKNHKPKKNEEETTAS